MFFLQFVPQPSFFLCLRKAVVRNRGIFWVSSFIFYTAYMSETKLLVFKKKKKKKKKKRKELSLTLRID